MDMSRSDASRVHIFVAKKLGVSGKLLIFAADMNIPIAILLFCTTAFNVSLPWGDQGNGTYVNPVLNADFSDPDVIRVGTKYYMVASDFHFMGMQVLESTDMVNWRYVSQIYRRIDEPGWDTNSHYAGGSWAPAIRYHDGL